MTSPVSSSLRQTRPRPTKNVTAGQKAAQDQAKGRATPSRAKDKLYNAWKRGERYVGGRRAQLSPADRAGLKNPSTRAATARRVADRHAERNALVTAFGGRANLQKAQQRFSRWSASERAAVAGTSEAGAPKTLRDAVFRSTTSTAKREDIVRDVARRAGVAVPPRGGAGSPLSERSVGSRSGQMARSLIGQERTPPATDAQKAWFMKNVLPLMVPGGAVARAAAALKPVAGAVGRRLASVVGRVARPAGVPKSLSVSARQLGKKLAQRAQELGLKPGNAAHRTQFEKMVRKTFDRAQEFRKGMFRGQGKNGADGPVLFARRGNNVVVATPSGQFITFLPNAASTNKRFLGAQVIR